SHRRNDCGRRLLREGRGLTRRYRLKPSARRTSTSVTTCILRSAQTLGILGAALTLARPSYATTLTPAPPTSARAMTNGSACDFVEFGFTKLGYAFTISLTLRACGSSTSTKNPSPA